MLMFPLLILLPLTYVPGSPTDILIDSTREISFISTPQVLCFKVPDTFEWPIYMLRDVLITLSLQTPVVGYADEIQPVSALETLNVQKISHQQLSDNPDDIRSICSPSTTLNSDIFSLSFPSIFTSASDLSKVLTTINSVNFTTAAFPLPCLAICRDPIQPNFLPLKLHVNVTSSFNEMNVFKFVLGLLILCFSNYLSQTISFYYVSGVSFTVLGSLLIALFLFIRMLPFRRGGTILQGLFILIGSTFSLSCLLFQFLRSTMLELLVNNAEYTSIYVIVVGCLSFVFLYWFHLPDLLVNRYPRTLVVMKYMLRLIGATLFTYSLHFPFDEVSFGRICLSLVSSHLVSQADHSKTFSRTLDSYAPKFFRILFIIGLVLLTDLLECWRLSPSDNRKKRRKTAWLQSANFENCLNIPTLPGSPWASSSPYEGDARIPHFQRPRKSDHLSQNYGTRKLNTERLSGIPYTDATNYHQSRRSFGPYANQRFVPMHLSDTYDLLTDDEDD